MKANYHTHTQRCRHAQGTETDYIQEALKAGVSILGFSDHAPFPDHDFGFRMPYTELAEHFQEVDRLTELYASDIVIRKGLEIEYLPKYRDYYERLLTQDRITEKPPPSFRQPRAPRRTSNTQEESLMR